VEKLPEEEIEEKRKRSIPRRGRKIKGERRKGCH
jgi:hypothetical protein